MRKLATIRTVKNIFPIDGADRIELVQLDGWVCIAKKDEFHIDDLAVYFEIDSFLPVDERYAFLGKTLQHQNLEGYRIRTMKMRGVLSQGLALPLHMFPELTKPHAGDDVTEALGVTKYDNAMTYEGKKAANAPKNSSKFPSFIPKTDEERIQNLPNYFEIHKNTYFEETLKLNGQSCTIFKVPHQLTLWEKVKCFFGVDVKSYRFGVCSRNLEIKRNDNYETTFKNGDGKTSTYAQSDFWKVAEMYDVERTIPENMAIQGELIGPRIQSNHEKVDKLGYYVYNIYLIDEERYATPAERANIMAHHMPQVKHVPVVNSSIKIFEEQHTVDDLLQHVEGESMNPNTISEGRVYKSLDGRVTFKAISNKYLLKSEK